MSLPFLGFLVLWKSRGHGVYETEWIGPSIVLFGVVFVARSAE